MTPLLADLAAWWLQSGLLLGAGLLLPSLLRLRDPGVRLRLGQLLLAAALLLPLVQPAARPAGGEETAALPRFSLAVLVTGDAARGPVSLETAVLSILAVGAVLRLCGLGIGLARLRAVRRRSRPLSPLPAVVASAAARTGTSAEFLVSRDVGSPVTLGWLRPAVLLPEAFSSLGPAEQEAVACHELLHVKRRDAWSLLLEEGARALLWAQPAAWALLSGISLSREQAVDRAVVSATGDRRAYLRALAALARLRLDSPAAALPFHTSSHLARRVAHLKQEVPMTRTRLALVTAAAAALLFLVGTAGAASFPFAGDAAAGPALVAAEPAPANDAVTGGVAGGVEGGVAGGVAGGIEGGVKEGVGDDGEVRKVGGDIKEPVVVKRVPPVYPEEARKNRVQGKVILEAVVDEKGSVTKAEAVESPDPLLSEAALTAVKQWTYAPAMLEGKPVKVYLRVTVNFRLE